MALSIQNVVLRPPAAAVAARRNFLEMQNYRIRPQPRSTESESSFYQDTRMIYMYIKVLETAISASEDDCISGYLLFWEKNWSKVQIYTNSWPIVNHFDKFSRVTEGKIRRLVTRRPNEKVCGWISSDRCRQWQ